MDLAAYLDAAHAFDAAFRGRWEPVAAAPAAEVDPGRLAAAWAEYTGRLQDNYPFFHPRYAGQMLKPPHPVAVAGYLAAMTVNPNNHALDGGPATGAMEKEVVGDLAAMFGLPGDTLGHLTSSGTIANLEALWVARQLAPGRAVAHSQDAHYTHARMCEVLGIESVAVPADAAGRMDLDALEALLASGRVGTVVLTAGTTGLGAIDDVRDLDWLTKLAGQVLAGGIMAFFGVRLLSLPIGGTTVLDGPVLVMLTILVVVISTNAVNFIDGLDGLAAGVVLIAASAFFAWTYLVSRAFDPPNVFHVATFISAAIIGICLGFLPHNFHPARLFMGDAGALLLGLLLAAATISMTGSVDPSSSLASASALTAILLPVVIPLAIMALPFLDILLAVRRRTRAGQLPWKPDRGHLHHRMLDIGHSHRQAVLLRDRAIQLVVKHEPDHRPMGPTPLVLRTCPFCRSGLHRKPHPGDGSPVLSVTAERDRRSSSPLVREAPPAVSVRTSHEARSRSQPRIGR